MTARKFYDRVVCADGFSVSVQASRSNYSEPRDNLGPYSEVELGFPSAPDNLIQDYGEFCGTDDPTETVYPWVPAIIVVYLIRKHGGIVSGEIPTLKLGPHGPYVHTDTLQATAT